MNKKHAKRIRQLAEELPKRQDGWLESTKFQSGSDLLSNGVTEVNGVKVVAHQPYFVKGKEPRMVSRESELKQIYRTRGGIQAVEAWAAAVILKHTS